ncbi:MAG: CHAT domain-containing protein [Candidatus Eisenbacteria bacterium]
MSPDFDPHVERVGNRARPTALRSGRRKAGAALRRIAVLLVLAGSNSIAHGDPTGDAGAARDFEVIRDLQQHGRWAASDSLASVTLTRLEREPAADSLAMATALYLRAQARWNLVGYADGTALGAATGCLGIRVRRLGTDRLEVAEADHLVANLLLGSDRADSALVHIRRAIDIRTAKLAPDDTLLATSWDALALIQRSRQQFQAALDAWNQAIEVRRRSDGPESPAVAALLGQTGLCWAELEDYERARLVLHQSLDMFARTGPDDPQRWIPLNLLADLERRTGNLALDIDLLREALRVVQPHYGGESRKALTLRFNLAVGLYDLGDFAGARETYSDLIPLMRAQYGPSHPSTMLPSIGLARASAGVGDTAAAMRGFREVEATLAARPGVPDPNLPVAQSDQAELLLEQGHDVEARAMVERAIQTDTRRPGVGSRTRVTPGHDFVLTMVLAALGDTAALDSTRRELTRMYDKAVLRSSRVAASVQYYRARGAAARGLADEAWTEALDAERLSRERLHLNLQALPDRRALGFTRQQTGYLDLVLALSRDGDRARQETAWDRLVRSRGLVGADLSRRRPPPGFETDTTVLGAHARWVDAQRVLAQRLVSASRSNSDSLTRVAVERLRTSADEAEGAYAEVLKRRGSEMKPPDVGLAEVRARLHPGQALVAFVETQGDLPDLLPCAFCHDSSTVVAFVARAGADTIDRIELGRSSVLRRVIDPWQARLGVPPGSSARSGAAAERECRRLGAEVRARTWDRIAGRTAGAGDVFIVGDGPLLDLPWQALPDGPHAYLVETGPRLHFLHAERDLVEPVPPAGPGSMLALGAPDFDHGGSATPSSPALVAAVVRSIPDPCAGEGPTLLAPLPGSGVEATDVAHEWQAQPGQSAELLLGRDATESAFKRDAHGRSVLHLATHGVVARDTCGGAGSGARGVGGVMSVVPVSSGTHAIASTETAHEAVPVPTPWMGRRVWLALAGANHAAEHTQDENEGLLTSEEVITLDLAGTDWVVLSACHSGIAENWSREGALGMVRAFQLAGARSVIASQWAIADDATGEWMAALYAARRTGEVHAAAAAAAASRTVLAARRRSGRSTHPFYWAAFTTIGD